MTFHVFFFLELSDLNFDWSIRFICRITITSITNVLDGFVCFFIKKTTTLQDQNLKNKQSQDVNISVAYIFCLGFLQQTLTIHRAAKKGRDHFYSSLPFPPTHKHSEIYLLFCYLLFLIVAHLTTTLTLNFNLNGLMLISFCLLILSDLITPISQMKGNFELALNMILFQTKRLTK